MSEHIGPGNDSGAFKDDEAKIRARVEKLDRDRRDLINAEIAAAESETEKPKAKSKKK